jgi:PadR family transcriptional regulator AphA
MSMDRPLTPTSYALLGLLAMRPWSSYELTKQMGRALHYVLPRAESNVYAEAKRLVDAGLATAEREATGRRGRTVYTITDAGRTALDAWLTTPARTTILEAEALVKILFADRIPPSDLLLHIERFEEEAQRTQTAWTEIAQDYLEDRGPFPERLHVNTLFWVFAARYTRMRVEWARWATEFVHGWPGPEGPGADAVKRVLASELPSDLPSDR